MQTRGLEHNTKKSLARDLPFGRTRWLGLWGPMPYQTGLHTISQPTVLRPLQCFRTLGAQGYVPHVPHHIVCDHDNSTMCALCKPHSLNCPVQAFS